MRNPSTIVVGVVLFILGLLLRSGLVEWLLNAIGFLAMAAGVLVFAVGVWNVARRRS